MAKTTKLKLTELEEAIKSNFITCNYLFMELQNSFLIDVYQKNYRDFEISNILTLLNRDLHQKILHQRVFDLNYDISIDNFKKNFEQINQENKKIIYISKQTALPKETARRKISFLLKRKIIRTERKDYFLHPSVIDINGLSLPQNNQINSLAKLINEMSESINLNSSYENIKYNIKKNYSFYLYHYLKVFLEWTSLWQKKYHDLDMLVIYLQCLIKNYFFYHKQGVKTYKDFYLKKSISKINMPEISIGASTISDVTHIPRASCIRKLDKLCSLKMISKDDKKRYFINLNQNSDSEFSKEHSKNTMSIFTKFFLILANNLNN
jgi:hypothetical protein|tara:strand:- start:586 stop:1554 length:969 start_codon:yes stop_codon:yes gene_type:complete